MSPQHPFLENRRSTRVPLEITIEIEGMTQAIICSGQTIVVNKHGALISTSQGLKVEMKVLLHVYLTGKKSGARVVNISANSPFHSGVELDQPMNIWGVAAP